MFKKFLLEHRYFFYLIFTVIFCFAIINLFVAKNRAFLAGEYLFSFDYTGHLQNIVREYFLNPDRNQTLAKCDGCPIYYQNSPWIKFWYLSWLGSGSIIGLHPFLTYLFWTIIVQLSFLYLFVRVLLKKYYFFPYLVASVVFIAFPQKIYALPSASQDGIIQGFMIGGITLLIYLFRGIASFSWKKLLLTSFLLGLILSVQLNIAIGYLPIMFYGLVAIAAFYIIKLISTPYEKRATAYSLFIKIILSLCIATIVVIVLNLPIVISEFLNGDTHKLTNFNPETYINSITLYSIVDGLGNWYTFMFFLVVSLLLIFSNLTLKSKCLLFSLYLAITFFMTGGRIGYIYLYDPIFSYFPLMEHMRSLYRLTFYQLFTLFIIIYFGFSKLMTYKNSQKRLLITICVCVISLVIATYINSQLHMFQSVVVPNEYFQADQYLSQKNEKKIYFPFYVSPNILSMSESFDWFTAKPRDAGVRTMHANPFTSLFAIPNMTVAEGYPLTTDQSQLRALLDYNYSQDKLQTLELLGIRYLIVDRNYLWKDYFPNFDLNTITQNVKLEKKFGKIEIYHLEDKQNQCKLSYGDFLVGYCYAQNHPEYLINKTPQDYVLSNLLLSKNTYQIQKNKAIRLPDNILNSDTIDQVIQEKIAIPFPVYQADNVIDNIYQKDLTKGEYKFFIPVLQLSSAKKIFQNINLQINLNGKVIKTISPYGAYHGISWQEVDINVTKPTPLSVGTNGSGFIVFGNPLLFTDEQMKAVTEQVKQYNNLKLVNTYGEDSTNLQVKVNNQNLQPQEKYGKSVEIDFLSDHYKNAVLNTKQFTTTNALLDGIPAFATTTSDNTLENILTFNQPPSMLDFTLNTAFLDSDTLGTLKIMDENDQILFQAPIFEKDTPFVTISVPKDILAQANGTLKIQLQIAKKGVLLYRYVVRGRF